MGLTENMKLRIRVCDSGRFELQGNLHDEDIPELIEALQDKPSIQYLDLSSNMIEEAGAILLAQLKHLIHLNLSNNHITNKAVEVLLLNKNLISIDCSENILLDDSLANFILSKPTHHTCLEFDRTEISHNLLKQIEKRCLKNREAYNKILYSKVDEERKEGISDTDEISSNTGSSNSTPASSESVSIEMASQKIAKPMQNTSNGFFAFFKCFSESKTRSHEAPSAQRQRFGKS
jgi:hypothetical protein